MTFEVAQSITKNAAKKSAKKTGKESKVRHKALGLANQEVSDSDEMAVNNPMGPGGITTEDSDGNDNDNEDILVTEDVSDNQAIGPDELGLEDLNSTYCSV